MCGDGKPLGAAAATRCDQSGVAHAGEKLMHRLPRDEDAASECRVGKTWTLGEMFQA